MKNKKFTKTELINLLVKKANGFYFTEEQLEYEKGSKPAKKNDEIFSEENCFEKNLKKVVRVSGKSQDTHGTIEVSGENIATENGEDKLNLVKKKVTTHFVPPDMIAIKILFEIFEKKVDDNDLEKISDDELMKLKTKLLEELKNDDI